MRIACILELAESSQDGGRKVATLQLVARLRERGVEVDVLSFGSGLPRMVPRPLREFPVLRAVSGFPLAGRRILPSLEGRYDLIYLTSTSTAALYRPAAPSLLYCHGVIAHKWEKFDLRFPYTLLFNRLTRAVVSWFERRGIENAGAVIVVHPSTLDFILRGLPAQPAKSFVLGNGVDESLFSPADVEGSGVIFVGRATASKGFDVLLEAAPHIGVPVRAVVYKIDRKLMDEAKRLGVEVITGAPHERMPHFYRSASIFVLPSLDEEQPLTTLEAMACGLPAVVSSAAAADLIVDGVNGLIIPDRDPGSLVGAVKRLLGDAALRSEMGRRNRLSVEEGHTWDGVADGFLDICNGMLGG
jgi:glycosyltransferase involved in cell wall biosynthesis